MEITEVRVSLKEAGNKKLKAFATVTFDDDFVVRDIKIIEGRQGLFVAMPSAKVMYNCPGCGKKNPIRNVYCGECGGTLEPPRRDVPARREPQLDFESNFAPEDFEDAVGRCKEYISAGKLREDPAISTRGIFWPVRFHRSCKRLHSLLGWKVSS